MKKNWFERVFYPVGHGAFYVERFFMDGNSIPVFTVVFDCGCYNKTPLNTYISRINQQVHCAFKPNDTVDVLFISHFHTDHIDGIEELLRCCVVKRIIVPQLSEKEKILLYIEELAQSDEKDCDVIMNQYRNIQNLYAKYNVVQIAHTQESVGNEEHIGIVDIDSATGIIPSGGHLQKKVGGCIKWTYTPFNPIISKRRVAKLNKELNNSPVFCNYFTSSNNNKWEELSEKVKGHIKELREVFDKAFPNGHNEYSMAVLSSCGDCCHQPCEKACHKAIDAQSRYCTLNCLYMGDFQPDTVNLPLLLKAYDDLRYVGILQVPHRGSEHNYDEKNSIKHQRYVLSLRIHPINTVILTTQRLPGL